MVDAQTADETNMLGLRRIAILFIGVMLAIFLAPYQDGALSMLAVLGSLLFWMGDERRAEKPAVVEVHHHHYGTPPD